MLCFVSRWRSIWFNHIQCVRLFPNVIPVCIFFSGWEQSITKLPFSMKRLCRINGKLDIWNLSAGLSSTHISARFLFMAEHVTCLHLNMMRFLILFWREITWSALLNIHCYYTRQSSLVHYKTFHVSLWGTGASYKLPWLPTSHTARIIRRNRIGCQMEGKSFT